MNQFNTTSNPDPCGSCVKCGGQKYIGLVHCCSTGIPLSLTTISGQIIYRIVQVLQ